MLAQRESSAVIDAGRATVVALVLFYLVAVALFAPLAAPAAPVGSITGHVYDAGSGDPERWGAPIEGLTVRVWEYVESPAPHWVGPIAAASTDVQGFYEFMGLEAGVTGTTYAVGVSAGSTDTVGTDYLASFYQNGETTVTAATPIQLTEGGVEAVTDVDVYTSPVAPSIKGTVKGSDFVPRLPIAGLAVTAYYFDDAEGFWMEQAWGESDVDGVYRLWSLPTGVYRVGYLAPRPDIYGVRWKTELWTAASASTGVGATTIETADDIAFTSGVGSHIVGKDLLLDKAMRVVSGTVTLRGTSTKLGGIDVNIYDPKQMAEGQYAGTTTDANGFYEFWDDELPATPTSSVVEFRGVGYDGEFYSHASKIESATPLRLSSAMTPIANVNGSLARVAPSIEGTVTTGGGTGIAGVAVAMYSDGQDPAVDWPAVLEFTDADGHYEHYAWWMGSTEQYKVRFYTGDIPDAVLDVFGPGEAPSEYGSRWYDNALFASGATAVEVGPATHVVASAVLPADSIPSITGFVRGASGAPIAGVVPEAWAYDADLDEYYLCEWGPETGADGAYSMYGLGNGEYLVGIPAGWQSAGFFRQAWWNGASTLEEATPVVTSGGDTVSDVTVVVTELPPLMSGRVTNAKTGAGIPAAYVGIYRNMGDDTWEVSEDDVLSTAPDGTWQYYSANGDEAYRVEFAADGFFAEYYDNAPDVDSADDVAVTPGTTTANVNAALLPQAFTAMRYDGMGYGTSNRYTVAAEIAGLMTEGYDYNPHIILACGEDAAMADPLAASGLSWAYGNAPLLLTPKGPAAPNYTTPAVPRYVLDSLVAAVRNVRATHKADGITLHIVGGTASVPDARVLEMRIYIQRKLGLSSAEAAKAFKVDRIAGATRYDNAYLIARVMKTRRGAEMPGVALVVNGSDATKFWDAMSASPMSAGRGVPLILVQTGAVPTAASKTVSYLGLPPSKLYVVGPTTSVSAAVASTLKTTNRIKGSTPDSYATAKAVSEWGIARGYSDKVTCAITAALPDALGAGPYLGMRRGSMLFVSKGALTVPTPTRTFLSARKATLRDVFIFGGKASVTTAQQTAINNALKP